MIDVHCHLDLYRSPGRVIAEIDRRGTFVIAVTTTPKAFPGNVRLTEGQKRIRVAVGLHPELVATRFDEVDDVQKHMPQTKYVGEIGIDGSPEHAPSLVLQSEVFTTILKNAETLGGKVLSIHSRGAATPVLNAIEKQVSKSLPILHWFSGTRKELERANELGCWFSIGPAMLRSRKGRDLAAAIPRRRILTETDGPFASIDETPLMPWDAERVLPILAELWNLPADETKRGIEANFRAMVSATDHRLDEGRTAQAPRTGHADL
ncbi:Qat anti-phage system TatD family nuclease QatD [Mesorhizobium sp. M0322]|uniref:Qat anti-phage system TatD family nuclease QatD n=1 Tax=Mesorhizobium sp. M0322 TaxID=2956937 RepID=UPI0033391507